MRRARRSLRELFVRQSVNRLRHDYLPKIRACVDQLDDDQIWWSPHPACNSIGHLLLHLEGNLRQWVCHGVGGQPDSRVRDAEFAPEQRVPREHLMRRIEGAIDEAIEVIRGLDEDDLGAPRRVQVYRTSGLGAVYHAVEHFAGHTGQIIWITKLQLGRDLRFYDL